MGIVPPSTSRGEAGWAGSWLREGRRGMECRIREQGGDEVDSRAKPEPAVAVMQLRAGTGIGLGIGTPFAWHADAPAVSGERTDVEAEAGAEDATPRESAAEEQPDSASGVDTEHVMNLTFVLTLLFGVPVVVILSLFVPLEGWDEIVMFVVQVGAAIWFLTAVTLYVRERIRD